MRETLAQHASIRQLERELTTLQEKLVLRLHRLIGGLSDKQLRGTLLGLKRDLHNGRPLRSGKLASLAERLEPDLEDGLARYRSLHTQRQELTTVLRSTFERELIEIRRRFQKLVDVEDFRNGLLLSSRTLANELPRYTRTPADRLGSKARQVERSLMRYFSRATMKATPFSTFCAIVPGRFVERACHEGVGFRGDPFQKRGILRINKAIYARIIHQLLQRPRIRRHFHVELNPTLHAETHQRWLFLAAVDGREVFQRLARNPVLNQLREQLDRNTLSLATLTGLLVSDPKLDADKAAVIAYLDRLLEIGFLRFRIGIREQEIDWDRPLCEMLAGIDDPHAAASRDLLAILRSGVDVYASSATDHRKVILDAASKELDALNTMLEKALLPARQPIFYEDAGGAADLNLEPAGLGEILVEYAHLISRLAWPRTEQAGMRHFFEATYGAEHGPVPLLRFYEDYFRQHFKAHLEREQGHQAGQHGPEDDEAKDHETKDHKPAHYDLANPFDLDFVRAIQAAGQALTERVRALWRDSPEAEEICLDRSDLETALTDVPADHEAFRSVSLFAQWVDHFGAEGEPALIVNSMLNGYGKYFSRFLEVLPDEIRRDLVANNLLLTQQELAEICGDGAFNANLHPPLLPREISYPTGETGDAAVQLPTSQIEVERHPLDPHRLLLRSSTTDEAIVPVDLGFLNPRMRPPLFQLLSRFTPAANARISVPDAATPAGQGTKPGDTRRASVGGNEKTLRYRPRVTYRGRLILARRQWQISSINFPRRGKGETEAAYFLRLIDWRCGLGLPEEIFMRVQPMPPPLTFPPEKQNEQANAKAVEASTSSSQRSPRKLRSYLYKPQYIHFGNPLLVDLFSRAVENIEYALISFEERLPRSDQLLLSGNERCVSELLVQVDFPQTMAAQHQEVAHA